MATKKNNINDKVAAFFKGFAEADDEINFHFSNDVNYDKLPVISTGSLVLDDALSSGGFPKGRVIQLYGPSGSGKTLMAMLGIKQAQEENKDAMQVFIDAEQTYSEPWATQLGIDPRRVLIVDGEQAVNGRRCFTMLLGEPKEDAKTHVYKGKKTEGLMDKIANGEMNINMVVLDSLGQIIPPGEDVALVGKMNMALMARFLSKELKRLVLEVKNANIPFIIINHKKDNMDPYGADHTFSGGNTLMHTLSANVYFDASRAKDKQIFDNDDNKVGGVILATVEKSKFGPWPRKCEFTVDFRKGIINVEEEIYELAVKYNIIQKTSTVTHEYGDKKWTGKPKTIEALVKDEKMSAEIKAKIGEAREAERAAKKAEQEAAMGNTSTDEEEEEPIPE
jgi:recombination protein RecA